ncbi:MAG: hypothetical protein MUC56_15990 [Thermoanaerobaculales bacterium]|nr:hypothetical protein [Thermoanaerobaculales bacterium]
MRVAVAVLDRDGWQSETDVLVVTDGSRRRLLWVPRDLWCDGLGDRVNTAFRRGGHELLRTALAEHGLAVDGCLVLRRSAVEEALADVVLTVPVPRRLEFWYPLTPTSRLEDGRKRVVFDPPAAELRGERVHQWLGARSQVHGAGSDLFRIARQQEFLRALLASPFDVARVLADPARVSAMPADVAASLRGVDLGWSFETLGGMAPALIDGKQVLVMRASRGRWWWGRQRVAGALRRGLR